jgi:hypothetical protein
MPFRGVAIGVRWDCAKECDAVFERRGGAVLRPRGCLCFGFVAILLRDFLSRWSERDRVRGGV